MLYISTFLTGYLLSLIIFPTAVKFNIEQGLVKQNYLDNTIPNALGIVFIFVLLLEILLLDVIQDIEHFYTIFLIGGLFVSIAGLLDDLLYQKHEHVKGFKGHFKEFLKGNLTTGFIKALFGLIISLYMAANVSSSLIGFLVNSFVVMLSINFINLMDLRPGRAIKAFGIIGLLIIGINLLMEMENYVLAVTMGIILAYSKFDLKAQAMMGDTGSNLLGFIMGVSIIKLKNPYIILISLLFLVFINVLAEYISITRLIQKNRVLNFIDNLGRLNKI